MRVALDVTAVPARPVGAGVYTVALAQGLARTAGVELHLMTRRGDRERWHDLAPGATVVPLAPDARWARVAWMQARGHLRAGAPDVWHGPHYELPARLASPSVVTVHDLTFFDHPEWHERAKVAYFRRAITSSVRRASAIVCVSEYTASRLRAVAAPSAPITVVHHGVDHTRFHPDAPEADDLALLSTHGISPPYIAFLGTLEPRKDVPSLVRAFARIAPAHPDLRLVLAGGDGWGAREVASAIAASGVATRVLRPGYLDRHAIAAFLRRAEAVAYPSLEEGFGLPALEALATGAVLVTTSGSAIAEVVGDAALLVPPGDVAELANALRLALDPQTQARLRSDGPQRAAPFTWRRAVAAHVDLYRAVTERDRVSA